MSLPRATVIRSLLAIFIAVVVGLGFSQPSFAAYGTGAYGACTYQSQTGCSASSGAGAPNTGQEPTSLFWPSIAGLVGFLLISFVVIRYHNHQRAQKQS